MSEAAPHLGDDRRLQRIQSEILEMTAYGEPLQLVAETLCRRIEEIAPEAICSVLSIDREGRIHPVAAPSLPVSYSQSLDGAAIGPNCGSCGTAAFHGRPIVVTDIGKDPRWSGFRSRAVPLGLRACWSSPIKARGGRVIGTFALYYRTERGPTALETYLVETCVHVCAIALEHAEMQERSHRLAYYDTLTGLPNRLHADTLLKRQFACTGERQGLLIVDIDNLKITNDALGHAVGDELIRQVAARLAENVGRGTACRMGGDEFIALLEDCDTPERLAGIARRILKGMETPFTCDGHTVVPHVTIGGALFGRDGTDVDTVRQNADLALYEAKERGRGGFAEFTPQLRAAMTERLRWVREVEAALAEGRIVAHYQPVIALDTEEIIGVEALARLRTADGGTVAACYFQDALREPRVARRLTDAMLRNVAADIRRWLDLGIPFRHAGINVSMSDFQCGDLNDRITDAFYRHGVPLDLVVLEVTETVFVGGRDSVVANAVSRLREHGLRVALDDFGTGFASLTHLLSFPVDLIKLDRCFVARLPGDATGAVIVSALVDIVSKLGMTLVVEGIETPAQAAALKALGCRKGQGFLYSPACSFEEMTERLRADWRKRGHRRGGAEARRLAV